MPVLTPDAAFALLQSRPDVEVWLKDDGTDHLQYAYRVQFTNEPRKEMAIARRSTDDGVTVYLNKRSRIGEALEVLGLGRRFAGVKGKQEYPKGLVGRTGDKGIAAGAGSCPSLLPLHNDVLRVACGDLEGFRQLVNWYAGLDVAVAKSAPPPATALGSAPVAADAAASPVQTNVLGVQTDAADRIEPTDDTSTEADDDGRLADPEQRRAVERRAIDLAKAHYVALGFDVQEKGKPFDLLCTPKLLGAIATPVVHVEVKGSISVAATVHLTKNEIADTRQAGKVWRSDLYVVSQIELVRDGAGVWSGVSGVPEVHMDWSPEDDDLVATDFVYRVPRPQPR